MRTRRSQPIAVVALLVALAPARAGAETVLRLGTVAPEGSRPMKDLRAMTDEIERRSRGEIRIKWFSGGRLGDERAMAGLLGSETGTLDGAAFTDIGLGTLVPEMRFWHFPGLFRDMDEVDFIEQRYREDFVRWFEARGLVLVAWGDVGWIHFIADTPIRSFDDLRRRRAWFWADDRVASEAAQFLGLTIHSSSLGELVAQLREGKIDAWCYPPLAIIAWGIQGYARYVSELRWRFMVGALVIRKDVFEALPPDQQAIVLAVGRKWEPRLLKTWRAENEKALAAMIRQGTRLVKVGSEDQEAFAAAVRPVWDRLARLYGLEDLLRRFQADIARYREHRR